MDITRFLELIRTVYSDASLETSNDSKPNQLKVSIHSPDGDFTMICGRRMISFHLSADFKPFDMSIFDPTVTVVWSEHSKDMRCSRIIHCRDFEAAHECLKQIKSAKRKKIVKKKK